MLAFLKTWWKQVLAFLAAVGAIAKLVKEFRDDTALYLWALLILAVGSAAAALWYAGFAKPKRGDRGARGPRAAAPYRYSRNTRFAARGVLGLAVLAGLYLGGETLYRYYFPPAGTFYILKTRIDAGDKSADGHRMNDLLLRELQRGLEKYPDIEVVSVKQTVTQDQGSRQARALASRYPKAAVLWGFFGVSDSKVLVSLNLENLAGCSCGWLIPYKSSQYLDALQSKDDLANFKPQQELGTQALGLALLASSIDQFDREKWAEALRRVDHALSLNIQDRTVQSALLAQRAITLLRDDTALTPARIEQDKRNAGIALDRAIALDPANSVAHALLGVLHQLNNNHVAAIASLSTAIRLDSSNGAALNQRAESYRDTGERDKAAADYKAVLALPDEGGLHGPARKALDGLK